MKKLENNRYVNLEEHRLDLESRELFAKKKLVIYEILKSDAFKKKFDEKQYSSKRIITYLNNEIIANKEFNFTREGLNGNIIPNFLIQIKDSMFSQTKSFELQEQEVITKTLSNGGKIFSYKHSFSFDFLPKEGKFDYESFYKGFTAYNIIENTKISIDSYKERMEIFDSEIEKILKFEEEMELIYHQKIQSISPDFKTFIKLDI